MPLRYRWRDRKFRLGSTVTPLPRKRNLYEPSRTHELGGGEAYGAWAARVLSGAEAVRVEPWIRGCECRLSRLMRIIDAHKHFHYNAQMRKRFAVQRRDRTAAKRAAKRTRELESRR